MFKFFCYSLKICPTLYEKLHLEREIFPLKARLTIARQLAHALSYLHARGFIVKRLTSKVVYLDPKVKLYVVNLRLDDPSSIPQNGTYLEAMKVDQNMESNGEYDNHNPTTKEQMVTQGKRNSSNINIKEYEIDTGSSFSERIKVNRFLRFFPLAINKNYLFLFDADHQISASLYNQSAI